MPNMTKNYGLKKPLPEEFYDVSVQNENMDKIDSELKKRATLGADGKVSEDQLPDITNIPITSEVPSNSDIWIDPDDVSVEESHLTDTNNPHNVTPEQIGAVKTVNGIVPDESGNVNVQSGGSSIWTESTEHSGCFYRMVTTDRGDEKEWLNPPMSMDVLYRTAEQYKGWQVYKCIVRLYDGMTGLTDGYHYVDLPLNINGHECMINTMIDYSMEGWSISNGGQSAVTAKEEPAELFVGSSVSFKFDSTFVYDECLDITLSFTLYTFG